MSAVQVGGARNAMASVEEFYIKANVICGADCEVCQMGDV